MKLKITNINDNFLCSLYAAYALRNSSTFYFGKSSIITWKICKNPDKFCKFFKDFLQFFEYKKLRSSIITTKVSSIISSKEKFFLCSLA